MPQISHRLGTCARSMVVPLACSHLSSLLLWLGSTEMEHAVQASNFRDENQEWCASSAAMSEASAIGENIEAITFVFCKVLRDGT